MNLSKWGAFAFVVAVMPVSALADSCIAQSRGLSFYDSGYDINQVSYNVVNRCQAASVTDNNECQRSLQCGPYISNPYPSGQVVCNTASRNLNFQQLGSSTNVGGVLDQTVNQCKANSYTDNNECARNISCRDAGGGNGYPGNPGYPNPYPPTPGFPDPGYPNPGYPNPYPPAPGYPPIGGNVTCSTNSRGISFQQGGTDINSVSYAVVAQCQANSYTDNSECSQRLSCSNGSAYPGNPYPGNPFPGNPYPNPFPPVIGGPGNTPPPIIRGGEGGFPPVVITPPVIIGGGGIGGGSFPPPIVRGGGFPR